MFRDVQAYKNCVRVLNIFQRAMRYISVYIICYRACHCALFMAFDSCRAHAERKKEEEEYMKQLMDFLDRVS